MPKTQEQENFPVASKLFKSEYRQIITHYYDFARYCDDIADNPSLTTDDKIKMLDEAEQSLLKGGSVYCAELLKKDFEYEKLDFSLATDLLIAFRRDAEGVKYKTWAQLLDYCKYSAAPVGRFMLALHCENPSTYLPATALCSVLQIVNHLQDMKQDAISLGRIYIPEDCLHKHHVTIKALKASQCSKGLLFLINDILNRCDALLKDADILPAIIKNIRLKIYVCITIQLCKQLMMKMRNTDLLIEHITLSKTDWVKGILNGLWQAIRIRHKTLTTKGI